ncbi:MAG: hypothetical protein ACI87W_002309 [Halieaceae bacterium]|jgi:hypothetical protein
MTDTQKIEVPRDLGFEIGGPGRVYYNDVITDNVVESLMEMSALLWTIRDRQIVLEKVLAEKGIEVTSLIESHEPDEAEMEDRRLERESMVQQLFKSFLRRPSAGAAKDATAPSRRDMEDLV